MPSKLFAPGLLDGQVAIVSGGGSGLGRATALELSACGAQYGPAGVGTNAASGAMACIRSKRSMPRTILR